jgi:predicted AAA+ superfamily ATPase
LDKKGERTLYLNLDIEWDKPHFESQSALLRKIELELGKERSYVFIDEIQQKELEATKLNFWRTKDKAEVDFILERGRNIVPIEVKYKSLKKQEIPRSLRSFIEKYSPDKAYIVNLDYSNTLKINETMLFFLPYYELLYKKI